MTFRNYGSALARLVSFLVREKNKYALPLPDDVSKKIQDIRNVLVGNSNCAPEVLSKMIGTLLLCIWTQTWIKSAANNLGDPTVCFVALAMHKSDGGWEEPAQVTPLIAKLEYCMRLVMLHAIHNKSGDGPLLSQCYTLQKWFTEKHDSTFNSLRSLQHQATALVKSELGRQRVVWTDRRSYREMRFEGNAISFDKFSEMADHMHQDAIELFENRLLLGTRLRISTDGIVDDLSNTQVGYSFLTDRRNSTLANTDKLINIILDNPRLSEQFVLRDSLSGSQSPWNILAIQEWLYWYSQFHGILLALAEMMGGSPGRGTEMTCLQYKNTATRSHRGLVMFGSFLAIICRYHKSGSITGKDKTIPHALDAVTADLLLQDLVLLRPLAQLFAFICYPNNPEVQSLYNTQVFVNNKEAFTTERLSQIMRKYTLDSLGTELGVSDWRHVSAAFRRRICPRLDELVEEEGEGIDSVQALQSGHTRQTENRIYAVSADAMAGPGEDVLPQFLDASTDWQVAVGIVPGGHGLPYQDARMKKFHALANKGAIKKNYQGPTMSIGDQIREMAASFDAKLKEQTSTLLAKMESLLANAVLIPQSQHPSPAIHPVVHTKSKELDTPSSLASTLPPSSEPEQEFTVHASDLEDFNQLAEPVTDSDICESYKKKPI
jgi:hypothetical protein